MSRTHHRIVTVVSVIATIGVLVAGSGGHGPSAAVRAALAKQVTVDAGSVGSTGSGASTGSGGGDVPFQLDSGTDAGGGAGSSAAPAAADGGTVPVAAGGDVPVSSGTGTSGSDAAPAPATEPAAAPSKIKHVFVIALAGQGFDATFGAKSAARYLVERLVPKGVLLTNYSSLGRADLPDHLALIGGQPPNADTRRGCPTFAEFPQSVSKSASGEITGDGCVFPNTVTTIADQITAGGGTWRAYVEDQEKGPRGKVLCRRPESNGADDTAKGRPGDGYATRRNPFVYYHSLLDLGDCDANDGALTGLEADLRSARKTPSYAYVAPNLCNSGTESPCADGSPGGLAAADAFLATWVPKILASPAYKSDGLLVVTFAGSAAPALPGGTGANAPVRNGSLLISRFADPGSQAGADYDPYSLLRSLEDLFALKPLARAVSASSFAQTVLASAMTTPASD